MFRTLVPPFAAALLVTFSSTAAAQTFTTDDPVLRALWEEGMQRSQVVDLAQVLMDSIGPRLTGTPEMRASNDWLVARYTAWGINARNEQVGTWRGWRRGPSHVDLIRPRVRTLDARLLGWSPGTRRAVEAPVITIPAAGGDTARWWRDVRGKFVLASNPEPSCRPMFEWDSLATDTVFARFSAFRDSARSAWSARREALAVQERDLHARLEAAGAAGTLTFTWGQGYGAYRLFGARTQTMPVLGASCEDYGLLHRLAERGQGPVLRVDARAEMLGTIPVFNTIAQIRGSERPDEYVMLSAHLDSWDAASGATDNGTGTIVMLEAMRLLRQAYPNPKRTILVGHWASEEQGLNGARAFAADHPDIVAGLQALFNQDNGTGPIANISMQGLIGAAAHFTGWLSRIPSQLTERLDLSIPGSPGGGGSDYAAFICSGAPGFSLGSESWDYGRYTWHSNLDTFDKVAFDNVRENAVLVAMLAYLASEDSERVPRERRSVMPTNPRTGEQVAWPQCNPGRRSWEEYVR